MKTNRSIIPVSIFLSLVLILSSGFTFGQGRSNRGRSDNSISSSANRQTRYENNSGSQRTAYSNGRNERSSYNYSRNSRSSNTYEYTPSANHHNADKKKSQTYSHGYVKEHHYYHHTGTYSYHRPTTYHTWQYPAPWEYASHAIVFRHDHGDFFFHHGRFYRYHPVRGYYRVAHPSTIVFDYLPVGYEEVFIGGGLYYRYGEVFFEYSPWGYRMVPRPAGVIIAARF